MMRTRSLAPWLSKDSSLLEQNIVKRALCDVGLLEMPPGSNRSGRIDEYVSAVGSPLGSYWCAAALAAWWEEAGASIPPSSAGSCTVWLAWAKATKRFTNTAKPGYAVLYGANGSASHCGVVVRTAPLVLTVEGNTSLDGYSRNGIAVDLKPINITRVIGYVSPLPSFPTPE